MFLLIATILVAPMQQRDPQCMTKHGVTHCWEYIAKDWDPRESPAEWGKSSYYDSKAWGYYPLEKRHE